MFDLSSIYQGLLWSFAGLAAVIGLLLLAAARSGKKIDLKKELFGMIGIWILAALALTVIMR